MTDIPTLEPQWADKLNTLSICPECTGQFKNAIVEYDGSWNMTTFDNFEQEIEEMEEKPWRNEGIKISSPFYFHSYLIYYFQTFSNF